MRSSKYFLLLFMIHTLALADVSESTQYKTYVAHHRVGATLLQTLDRATPIRHDGKVFHGNTYWNIAWRFKQKYRPNGSCFITEIKTTMDAVITLPELTEADARTRQVFSSYVGALRHHELGHVKIAQDAAGKIDKGILSLSPMSSCASLAQTANQLGQRVLGEAKERGRSYDRSTQHGRNQGAWLPR